MRLAQKQKLKRAADGTGRCLYGEADGNNGQGSQTKGFDNERNSERRRLSFTRHLADGMLVTKDVVCLVMHNTWNCGEEEEVGEEDKKKVKRS